MKKLTSKQLGNLGEDLASKFLLKRGCSIVDRNYWQKSGEIDIIAKKDNVLRFIEVKTVSRENLVGQSEDVYRPEDNIHPWKLQRIARTIEIFLSKKEMDFDWQIDLITICLDIKNKKAKIDFLENIILS